MLPLLPPVDLPVKTGATAAHDAAVVVGIEDYPFLPDVPHARRDAEAMHATLVYTVGVPPDRVHLLTDAPSREKVLRAINTAAGQVGEGGRLWLYFAGHGSADAETSERLLLGVDAQADVSSFGARGVRVSELHGHARGVETLAILDTCYTGASRGEGDLVPGARLAVPSYALQPTAGFVEWGAAGPGQVSLPLDEVEHGAFTYFVLGALRGWADGEHDGKADGAVTLQEASLFVASQLRARGLDQQPSVSATPASVLVTGPLEPRPEAPEPAQALPVSKAAGEVSPLASLYRRDEPARIVDGGKHFWGGLSKTDELTLEAMGLTKKDRKSVARVADHERWPELFRRQLGNSDDLDGLTAYVVLRREQDVWLWVPAADNADAPHVWMRVPHDVLVRFGAGGVLPR